MPDATRETRGATPPDAAPAAPLVVIVTGMSGAGRTTAISALEDLGYEALNNFPLGLIEALIEPAASTASAIAIGIETRTRGFSVRALRDVLERLRALWGLRTLLIFLDCSDGELARRFGATRRRHPLAPAEDVATGIARERDVLAPLRAEADAVIDTTGLSPHALKAEIQARFPRDQAAGLAVSVQSFSYKRGAPAEADIVLDCRFLRNPYWDEGLRDLDGRHPDVQAFVAADPLYEAFFARLLDMALLLLPAYKAEGKAYLSIALGCTGGRHRSVTVAERLAARLTEAGWPAATRHRELEREARGEGSAR